MEPNLVGAIAICLGSGVLGIILSIRKRKARLPLKTQD